MIRLINEGVFKPNCFFTGCCEIIRDTTFKWLYCDVFQSQQEMEQNVRNRKYQQCTGIIPDVKILLYKLIDFRIWNSVETYKMCFGSTCHKSILKQNMNKSFKILWSHVANPLRAD